MNKLLLRQITKFWGHPDQVPEELKPFLKTISDTYDFNDRDRSMLERSIELTSTEMIGLNDRLRSESRELAKAHHELSTLFENIETVFFSMDLAENRLLQMSPSCEKIYGYSAEEFLKYPLLWFEVVVEEDKHIIESNYPLMHAGKSFSHTHRIQAKDGTIRWVETKITPTMSAEGKAVRLDGVTTDITAKKEAEELSLQHQIRFQKLIEKSHDGIAMLDANGKLVYVSPSVSRILGYSPEELLGVDPMAYTHPEDASELLPLLMGLIATPGESKRAVYRMKKQDGEWRWISSTITNLLREKYVNALVFNYQDITEHKAAQSQLEFDRRNTYSLINSTNDLMWSIDSEARLITANNAFLEGFEKALGKKIAPGDQLSEFVHLPPEAAEKWQNLYMRVLRGESFVYENHETVPFDQWGELSFNPILENGKVIGASCFWRDITEKKKYHEQLVSSQKMMADAQRISKVGCWEFSFDSQGEVAKDTVKWTEEMYRIYGFDPAFQQPDMEAKQERIYPADRILVHEWGQAVMSGTPIGSVNYRITTLAGELRWIRGTADIILDHQKRPVKMVGTIQDITERKALESERLQVTRDLVQRNKALEQFAHIVSHNLRAPVANILGLSQLIKLSGQNSDTQLQCIDGFVLSAKRLDEIVTDLNKILQLKRGASEEKVQVSFDGLVNNIRDSIKIQLEQEDVTIDTNFEEVPEIFTIKNYVHSIFYNLISNSVKYRQPHISPVISITSRVAGEKTVLSFKDNGQGIDLEKHRDEVFGLYKRFHMRGDGKGLGMYMVKTQVESLGGKISIRSAVNQGTEITIEL